ncbi:hypothetical protein [Bacteroides coprosuis]|uniref:hypothetical protein n=1 Tax=Bacteroides coprosuis TaxID=151276 RepID=UPI001DB121C2|nr:hypothetical protein [Bacteroides coprosuis]HJD93048.1 hypothetical protein [Bacteroides coprosuis]
MSYKKTDPFLRIFVITLMVLVCLPCSAKRELKLLLDIPVTSWEHKSDQKQIAACDVFSNDSNPTITVAKYISLPPFLADRVEDILIQHATQTFQNETYDADRGTPSIIPIYIIHEQYRI